MPEREILLLGGGGHAAVVAESAVLAGWTIAGMIDDRTDATLPVPGVPHLGPHPRKPDEFSEQIQDLMAAGVFVHAAVGDGNLREAWLSMFTDAPRATIIHPTAAVSDSAMIEPGGFIGPNAVVNARAVIGSNVIVNSGAVVEHDVHVGDHAHLAPRSVLAGESRVGACTLIGAGAVVIPKIRVGSNAILGAGSVATSDIADDVTAVGSPATILPT